MFPSNIIEYPGYKPPEIHKTAFIDPSAIIIGEVELKEKSSVWMGAIVRSDDGHITVGVGASILEHALVEAGTTTVEIGDYALVNHCAVVHGAIVEEEALVGIGSIVLNGARIGKGAVVGAGAIVTENKEIPPYTLALGIPAKPIRELKEKEVVFFKQIVHSFSEKAAVYKKLRSEKWVARAKD